MDASISNVPPGSSHPPGLRGRITPRSESEAEGHGARSGALGQRESWMQAMFGLASHPSVLG